MSEDEVHQMEKRVLGEVLLDPDLERDWTEQQIAQMEKTEQQLICAFRLHKFMRNEAAMQKNDLDQQTVRESLRYLKKRLTELCGS